MHSQCNSALWQQSFATRGLAPDQRGTFCAALRSGSLTSGCNGHLGLQEVQATVKRRLAAEQAAEQMAACTFKPAINAAATPRDYRPIQERVGEVLRSKSEKVAAMRLATEHDHPDATFAPIINDRSVQLARKQRRNSWCAAQRPHMRGAVAHVASRSMAYAHFTCAVALLAFHVTCHAFSSAAFCYRLCPSGAQHEHLG